MLYIIATVFLFLILLNSQGNTTFSTAELTIDVFKTNACSYLFFKTF